MGQQDIIEFLEKEEEWICAKEISKKINIGESNVRLLLNKLYKFGEVIYKDIKRGKHCVRFWKIK